MDTTKLPSPRLVNLIQEAALQAGNEAKLARLIDETRHHVNAWKQGKRTCSIEAQILMASVAKQDVDEVIKAALIERNLGTPRGEKLISAMTKTMQGIGAVTVLTLSGSDVLASSFAANFPGVLRCILC